MKKVIYLFLFTGLIFSGCVKDSEFMEESEMEQIESKKAKKLKPFKGTLISYPAESVDLSCDCGGVPPLFIQGSGDISQMGEVQSDGVSCAIPQPWGFSVDGCVSLVAANGDEVFAEVDPYDLIFDTTCFCKANGTTYGQITGGTGRFANAAGEVDIEVELDLATFKFTVNLDGGISY